MIVKICGLTRMEDAEAAVALGATALGFNFWPGSPRFIDPFNAKRIIARVPAFVTTVGVFVNQPESFINGVASLTGLGAVQLHGDEDPGFAARIRRPVIKALTQIEESVMDAWPENVMLLIDAHDPVRRGGTGLQADWAAAAVLARKRRMLLAGGLNPFNVAEAIEQVQPFGVDVSSGVEESPGKKDARRIAALFMAIANGVSLLEEER